MKTLIYLFSLFLSFTSLARVELALHFPESEVKQGNHVRAILSVEADSLGNLQLQKLKGATFADTIYFYQIDPPLRKDGSSRFEAEVKLIFIEAPSSPLVSGAFLGEDLVFALGSVRVLPTEASPQLVFGTFEIPPRDKLIFWGLLVLIPLIAWPSWLIWSRFRQKQRVKKERARLKAELLSAKNYEDVVERWKKKHLYLSTFPKIEGPFRDLETVLFRYQFRPTQTEAEKTEVVRSYQKFTGLVEGDFDGV